MSAKPNSISPLNPVPLVVHGHNPIYPIYWNCDMPYAWQAGLCATGIMSNYVRPNVWPSEFIYFLWPVFRRDRFKELTHQQWG